MTTLIEFDETGASITTIQSKATVLDILGEVAKKHGFTLVELLGDGRHRELVVARHEAMWRCLRETGKSGAAIARMLRRDHTMVAHGARRHEERMKAGEV